MSGVSNDWPKKNSFRGCFEESKGWRRPLPGTQWFFEASLVTRIFAKSLVNGLEI